MKENFIGVIVDAGHGGIDSGAVGNNLKEKDLTLKASRYMYDRLRELGIPAKMTREDDTYLPKPDRIKKVLSLYNNSPNTILIANHINAGGGEGAEVVYSLKNNSTLADLIINNIGEKGQIKRKVYQRRLPENPNKDYYYILRESGNTEPVLVEYGFIDNKNDSEKLKNNILDYTEAVVKAITEYLGFPYTPPNQKPNNTTDYIVKRGDTLYSISNLNSNILSIGQLLKLKESNNVDNYSEYKVEKNDTLYSIASKFNTTVDKIKELNNLQNNMLMIGQLLIIPEEEIKDEIIEDNEYSTYIVKRGDSLYKIARDNNITVDELININNLDNLTIQIGQELLVPKIEEEFYIVEKGDTLWSVSKKNNITVDQLKELNNLTSNLLSVGQKLKVK